MLRTIRPIVRCSSIQRCHCYRSTVASTESDVDQQVVTDYDKAKPFDEIPGPSGLPYIGTMLQYRKGPFHKYDIDRFQDALMDRYHKYGKIMKESTLGTTIVHLFDPDYIRIVFQSEGKLPHVAPLMETTRLYRQQRDRALGLGNINGEEWYRLRSAVQRMMMRPKAVTVYLPLVESVADVFIRRLKKVRVDKSKVVPNLLNEISKWNVKSAAMTVFEMDLDPLDAGPNSEVQQMINANSEMFQMTAYLKFRIPVHNWFKTRSWKRLVEAEDCLVRINQKYLDETIGKMRAMLDMDQMNEDDYKFIHYLLGRKELTQKDIVIICQSLFGDGLATTAPTLACNLYCLAKYTEVQEKVYEEVQRVIPPTGPITPEMINSMSYLKAFVKETFRFFPIGLEVTRVPQQNLVIGGYQIPAGTRLDLNNFVMFKDPQYFEEPERFKPERWLRDGSARDIHPYILTPFSLGTRMCAGRAHCKQHREIALVPSKNIQSGSIKIKQKKYSWMTIPAIVNDEAETVLTVPDKDGNGTLVVVPVEKFFSTLRALHENLGHARVPTMWNKAKKQYAGLPQAAIRQFVSGCIGCQCRSVQVNEAEPKQIVATEVFSRVEVDLIDMSRKPSEPYHYILHLMDHFSKFHVILPLERKTADEVNVSLTKIFGTIGLPTILQTDNGGEFSKLGDIFTNWPGGSDVKIIHGRPGHPQTQGLVERGHRLIQDRLSIAEHEWMQDHQTPFPWHTRLPIIQFQVNSAYSRVIANTPYAVVFGREPKTAPLFGRGALVDEIDVIEGESYSTAYDQSDTELEAGEGHREREGPIVPATDNMNEAREEHFEREEELSEPNEPVINNMNEAREEHFEREEELSEPNEPVINNMNEPDRHESIREAARESTKKANDKRRQPKKGSRNDIINVGDFVTMPVPRDQRHKTDLLRLPGIVVNKRGDSRAQFMVRTQYGVVDGWHGHDVVQKITGCSLPLVVEGWEHCPIIPLRTAAARVHTRCQCKGSCVNNRCRCLKAGNSCDSSCHAGRACSNRPTTSDQETTEMDEEADHGTDGIGQPSSDNEAQWPFPRSIMTIVLPVIESLKQLRFSEAACDNALAMLSGAVRPNVLQYVKEEINDDLPTIPMERPEIDAPVLNTYGSGYMNFVPRNMRTSHCVYQSSDDRNRCLYNSVSLLLYGSESHSAFLKLLSTLKGFSEVEKIKEEMMQSVKTKEDIVRWAAGFTTALPGLNSEPEFIVSRIIENELLANMANNDSGPIQIMALANFLKMEIEVVCVNEDSGANHVYGEGPRTLKLICVPLNLDSADGQIRFNHFVPAVKRTREEEEELLETCGAKDLGICNITDTTEKEMVLCEDCGRWYHSLCLMDSTRGHTMKRQQSLKCGCWRQGEFKENQSTVLTDVKSINKVLTQHRRYLRDLLIDIENKKVPSWRSSFYSPSPGRVMRLLRLAGLAYPTDNVSERLKKFIQEQMPSPIITVRRLESVQFPELLIRLFNITWGINKVEAEYLINQRSAMYK